MVQHTLWERMLHFGLAYYPAIKNAICTIQKNAASDLAETAAADYDYMLIADCQGLAVLAKM